MRPNDVLRKGGNCPGWMDGWMKWFGLKAKIAITFKRKFAFYMNLLWCSSSSPPPHSDRDEKLIHHQPQRAVSDTGETSSTSLHLPCRTHLSLPSLPPHQTTGSFRFLSRTSSFILYSGWSGPNCGGRLGEEATVRPK